MEEKENPDDPDPFSTFPACSKKRSQRQRGNAGSRRDLPATAPLPSSLAPMQMQPPLNSNANPNPKRKDKMKQQHSAPLQPSSGSGSAPAPAPVPVNYFPRAVAPANANRLPSMEQSFLPPQHHLFPPSFAPVYSNQALMERFRPNHAGASSSGAEPMALVRSDGVVRPLLGVNPASPAAANQILRWKQKAKERKREIVRLREEIKLLRDGFGCELEPPIASCRCHFFDGCGEVGPPARDGSGDEHWIDSVLRRRFIRIVRWKERRTRVERPLERKNFMEFESEDEIGRLSISIDFLVELSDNVIAKGEVDSSFSTFSHQAIDFILASLKNILLSRHQREPLEEITNGLIMRLIKRMCTSSQKDCQTDSGSRLDIDLDPQFCVQHLIRKLGKDEFVGQRMMLSLSQKITIVAENLLLLDPFHDNFPSLHGSMFLLIQLIEFMITDYMTTWLNLEQFDKKLFEEWVRSILKARKDLEILANMNGLYVLYMDRVVALLAKEVGPAAHQGKLDPEVLSKLLS